MGMKRRPRRAKRNYDAEPYEPKYERSFPCFYTCKSCGRQKRFLERDGICASCAE